MQSSDKQSTSVLTTTREALSWGALVLIISNVIPEAAAEFSPPKSLPAGVTLAVTTPFALEVFKLALNASHVLNEDFRFNQKAIAAELLVLLGIALTLNYTTSGKGFSPLGYDSVITVTGSIFKLLEAFVLEPCFPSQPVGNVDSTPISNPMAQSLLENAEVGDSDVMSLVNLSDTTSPRSTPSQRSETEDVAPNGIPLHSARFVLLFCATRVGGKFFESMLIPLAEGLKAAGLTNYFALVMFSMYFNELLGTIFFVGTNKFKHIEPNFISQMITIITMTSIFQTANICKEETLVNFFLAFVVGFFSHLAVLESKLGKKIDDTAVAGFKGMAGLLSQGYQAAVRGYTAVQEEEVAPQA